MHVVVRGVSHPFLQLGVEGFAGRLAVIESACECRVGIRAEVLSRFLRATFKRLKDARHRVEVLLELVRGGWCPFDGLDVVGEALNHLDSQRSHTSDCSEGREGIGHVDRGTEMELNH